ITGTNRNIVGSSDVDSGRTSLTTPLMDLSKHITPTVATWLWYSRDRFPSQASTNDTMNVSMSNDNGRTWQIIDQILSTENAWKEYRYQVEQYMTPTAQMLFRVDASDLNTQSWVEAGLDDFRVIGTIVTGVEGETNAAVTRVNVVPNPVRDRAVVDVTFARAIADMRIELYDVLGRIVATVHAADVAAGAHRFDIDAALLSAGRYTWRVSAPSIETVSGAVNVVR
ncbi:MAG: hypothetical protein H7X80_11555, partial [bacterium]|nr:hypothetical protein [Candidatus Kapabacteria bacterium]